MRSINFLAFNVEEEEGSPEERAEMVSLSAVKHLGLPIHRALTVIHDSDHSEFLIPRTEHDLYNLLMENYDGNNI